MSDQDFHEIQLSGKQLVFLFMCVVVFTVVVFLFGVSVGRGVQPAGQVAQAAPAATPTVEVPPPEPPASAEAAPSELSYAEALREANPASVAPPEPISEEPPPAAPAPGTEAAPAAIEPPAPAAKMAEARSTPPPALSGWVVQVGAFSANDVASREAAKLQDKGYPAFVFAEPPSTPGPRYKVRVGPYSARAEADRMLSTLTREGYKPLLKR